MTKLLLESTTDRSTWPTVAELAPPKDGRWLAFNNGQAVPYMLRRFDGKCWRAPGVDGDAGEPDLSWRWMLAPEALGLAQPCEPSALERLGRTVVESNPAMVRDRAPGESVRVGVECWVSVGLWRRAAAEAGYSDCGQLEEIELSGDRPKGMAPAFVQPPETWEPYPHVPRLEVGTEALMWYVQRSVHDAGLGTPKDCPGWLARYGYGRWFRVGGPRVYTHRDESVLYWRRPTTTEETPQPERDRLKRELAAVNQQSVTPGLPSREAMATALEATHRALGGDGLWRKYPPGAGRDVDLTVEVPRMAEQMRTRADAAEKREAALRADITSYQRRVSDCAAAWREESIERDLMHTVSTELRVIARRGSAPATPASEGGGA
jgi:hypothetical protein